LWTREEDEGLPAAPVMRPGGGKTSEASGLPGPDHAHAHPNGSCCSRCKDPFDDLDLTVAVPGPGATALAPVKRPHLAAAPSLTLLRALGEALWAHIGLFLTPAAVVTVATLARPVTAEALGVAACTHAVTTLRLRSLDRPHGVGRPAQPAGIRCVRRRRRMMMMMMMIMRW
jgi:hypothetical protein